jgi:hypothetical protein
VLAELLREPRQERDRVRGRLRLRAGYDDLVGADVAQVSASVSLMRRPPKNIAAAMGRESSLSFESRSSTSPTSRYRGSDFR